jgi:hypothetical protein
MLSPVDVNAAAVASTVTDPVPTTTGSELSVSADALVNNNASKFLDISRSKFLTSFVVSMLLSSLASLLKNDKPPDNQSNGVLGGEELSVMLSTKRVVLFSISITEHLIVVEEPLYFG